MKRMGLLVLLVGLSVLSAWAGQARAARPGARIIPELEANSHGLTLAWFTQAQVHPGIGRITHIVLDRGTLFVQSDQATLHAIDAETGASLWAKQIGRRDHPSLTPSANGNVVAVVNGSDLFVVNRYTGKMLWTTELEGAPGAGADLSEHRAYVPMVNGLVYSYRLQPVKDPLLELGKTLESLSPEERATAEKEKRERFRLQQEYVPPLATQSVGRTMVQPLVTRDLNNEEVVAWPTDRGMLFVGGFRVNENDQFSIFHTLQTNAPMEARPACLTYDEAIPDSGIIFAASRDGFVRAVDERHGALVWRFSIGEPVIESPVAIGWHVYVTSQLGGVFCLDAKTGTQLWWSPGAVNFVSASEKRVYVVDELQRLVVLDAANGARLDAFSVVDLPIRVANSDSDRIYLASHQGLVQCLHEIELTEPIDHAESRRPKGHRAPAEDEPKADQPAQPLDNEAEADPFGDAADPFGDAADPFGDNAQPMPDPADDPVGAGGGGADPANDPFGAGGGGADPANDPFGAGGGGADPANDPFGAGGGGGDPADNPFGAGGGGGDPADNPFGAGGGGADPADNPFGAGGGGGDPADNPFGAGGGGGDPADDPFQ